MSKLMPWGANYTITAEIGGKQNPFVLVTDKTRTNLCTNPNFETNTTGWSAVGSAVLSRTTSTPYKGTNSLLVTHTPTGIAGASFSYTPTNGLSYAFSAYVRNTAGTTRNMNVVITWNGGTTATGTATSVASGSWVRLSVIGTAPNSLAATFAVNTSPVGDTQTTETAQIDAVLIEQSSTVDAYFDGTYTDAYTGYTLQSQSWSGTADASTSTAIWSTNSTLGYSILDGTRYLQGKILPQDITDRIQDVVISRGRNDPFQDITAGRATLALTNNDRALDPVNTTSPFWSTLDNASGVTLKRKVIIYYETTPIFTGLITDIDISYEIGPNNITISTVTFEVSDILADFASRTIEEYYPAIQQSGARVQAILALPEINYTGATSIDTGVVQCLDDPIADQTNCLTALQTVAKTESGYLFAKGDGTLRFTNRIGPGFYTPTVFADNGSGIPYENLAIVYGEETLYNRIVVTPLDSAYSAISQNTTSQGLYGIKTLSLSGLLFSDSDALKMADYLLSLYGTPTYRFNDMQLKFAGQKVNTTNQATIIGLDLGSVIRVIKTFSSGIPNSITLDAAIEMVKHHITPTVHEIEFALAPALTVYPLKLDDATYGVLDSIYALSA